MKDDKIFQLMRKELADVVRHLEQEGLLPFLYGSFAICLYADEPLIQTHDIDVAFRSREEHDQAVQCLERAHKFHPIQQNVWESDTGGESVNTKLRSPGGTEFDLSYTRGDIELTLDPKQTIIVHDIAVPVLSLDDLKKSYQRFFNEKPDAGAKIEIIEKLKEK